MADSSVQKRSSYIQSVRKKKISINKYLQNLNLKYQKFKSQFGTATPGICVPRQAIALPRWIATERQADGGTTSLGDPRGCRHPPSRSSATNAAASTPLMRPVSQWLAAQTHE